MLSYIHRAVVLKRPVEGHSRLGVHELRLNLSTLKQPPRTVVDPKGPQAGKGVVRLKHPPGMGWLLGRGDGQRWRHTQWSSSALGREGAGNHYGTGRSVPPCNKISRMMPVRYGQNRTPSKTEIGGRDHRYWKVFSVILTPIGPGKPSLVSGVSPWLWVTTAVLLSLAIAYIVFAAKEVRRQWREDDELEHGDLS